MSTQSLQNPAGRINGLDLARALAIFGMILENYVDTMVPDYTAGNPAWLVWLLSHLEGHSAPVFVILAGIGVSLMTQKARETADTEQMANYRRTILKRALFLFGVGFLHSLIWDPDILHFFAVYMLIASAFLTASSRRLFFAAIISTLTFPFLYLFCNYGAGWHFATLTYLDLWSMAGTLRHIFFNGFHPVFPWLAFFFIGMWLGRGVLFDPKIRTRILTGALATVAVIKTSAVVADRLFDISFERSTGSLFDLLGTNIMPPMPLYVLLSGAIAIIIIILSLMSYDRLKGWLGMFLLVRTGQMSLSIYLGHTLIGLLALDAMGMLKNQTLPFAVGYAALIILFSVSFAYLWRLVARHGPVEWVMRKI
jgi:uncharacterized membrane protein YeiB